MDMSGGSWTWAPQVFAGLYGEDVVALDVRSNEYLVLAGAAGKVRLDRPAGRVRIDDDGLAIQLNEQGLVLETVGPSPTRRRTAPEARGDLSNQPAERPRLGDWLAFAWTLIEMIPLYGLRPFRRLVSAGRRPIKRDESPLSDPLVRSALVFERMIVWAPVQGKCLFRAAMLRRFLQRRGLAADWVFGVRTWPFVAHCWLQVGAVVINDRVDYVAGFSPVMVV